VLDMMISRRPAVGTRYLQTRGLTWRNSTHSIRVHAPGRPPARFPRRPAGALSRPRFRHKSPAENSAGFGASGPSLHVIHISS